MDKPLIVYLDSSDISNLSDEAKRTDALVNVEKELLSLKEKGLIEFRFSHVHVIEAAPTNRQFIDLASKRFSYIKKLCGHKCFFSPILIIENEIERLTGSHIDASEVLNDEGIWYPPIDSAEDFGDLAKGFREQIALGPDRKTRRKAERQYFESNGTLSAFAKKEIKETAPALIKEICSKYPLLPENLKQASKYLLETGSAKYFLDEVKRSLADMDAIGNWYAHQWDLMNPQSSYLREIGTNLKSNLTEINEKLISLIDSYKNLGMNDGEVARMTEGNFSKLLISLPFNIAETIAKDKQFKLNRIPNWELTPSLLSVTTLYVSLVRAITLSGQRPRVSDFGDIYHASFIPHVDFFRADGAISSAIAKAKMPFNTVIVPKLENLPEQIQLKIKSK